MTTSLRNSDGTNILDVDGLKVLGITIIDPVKLNKETLNAYIADANTAGSVFVVCPFAGTIVSQSVVPSVANTTTKTVFLTKLATVTVTAPAWEIASAGAAGTAATVIPTATNTVTAGQVIEIAFDGGGSPVMPCQATITILRT